MSCICTNMRSDCGDDSGAMTATGVKSGVPVEGRVAVGTGGSSGISGCSRGSQENG